jgi:hypothetical protein
MKMVAVVAMAALVAAGTVVASSVDDDLAVVKRAVSVAQAQPPSAAPPAGLTDEPAVRDDADDDREIVRGRERARPRSGREPQWLKVRIMEKGQKKARVNINLPIALVRALGDDWPIDVGGHGRWRGRSGRETTIRMGEVLAALEAGQPLVEIDDDEATVRVWVE